MTKEELVIGNRYKIRRPSIADGNVNSYQWSDATLVDISTHIAVFSVGEYCVTYKFCQLRDEVKEDQTLSKYSKLIEDLESMNLDEEGEKKSK